MLLSTINGSATALFEPFHTNQVPWRLGSNLRASPSTRARSPGRVQREQDSGAVDRMRKIDIRA
jgi:hypothetical protein